MDIKKTYKKRIDDIRHSLINYGFSKLNPEVIQEFDEINRIKYGENNRSKYLLLAIHSMRGVDTALHLYCMEEGLKFRYPNMTQYLIELKKVKIINEKEFDKFNKKVVYKRNLYAHQAGQYPKDRTEIELILQEMNSLLQKVFGMK